MATKKKKRKHTLKPEREQLFWSVLSGVISELIVELIKKLLDW